MEQASTRRDPAPALVEAVAQYVHDASTGGTASDPLADERGGPVPRDASLHERFDSLALAILRLQARLVAPYRRLLHARGCDLERVAHWSEAPAIPTAAFKTTELLAAPARVVFRSSGTTRGAGRRSVHGHPYPELYRLIVDRSFPQACLPSGTPRPDMARPDMLSLVPPFAVASDSSLAFMVDHVLQTFGGRRSGWATGRHGLDERRARRWLDRAAALGAPVVVLATALALDELLRALEAAGVRLALPAGSVLFETGGFKGRHRQTSRAELLERAAERLGLLSERVVREYGMTELTSQAYTRVLAGGDPDVFFAPPWLRARVISPETLGVVPRGENGMLQLFDLGNVGSAAFVLTEDLARAEPDGGFRLVGRAAGAELRGCSLLAEELADARALSTTSAATPPRKSG